MQLKENPGEGEQSLRAVVKRLPIGSRAQFGLRDFPLKADKEISIRFLAKSPDYTPVTLTVVQKKPPLHFVFHAAHPAECAVVCALPLPGKARTLATDPAIEAYNLFGDLLAPGSDAPAGLHYLQTAMPAAWLVEQMGL